VANEFPPIWFDTFLSSTNTASVDRELEFVQHHLPVTDYPGLLDIPCGIGRHTGPLAKLGYRVIGADRSESALATARRQYPGVEFRRVDLFDLSAVGATFDAVLCLWQSFGYGSLDENRRILDDMRRLIRPGGRILLDVYNAEAAARLPQTETDRRGDRTVRTRRSWIDRRLRVELEYSDWPGVDTHEWEVFTPAEIAGLAESVDLSTVQCCAWFDADIPASAEHLRMQLLFERRQ
jgi:SAM-dependent methyltransferase